MPSYVTPKINTEFIFYISLVSQANTPDFQANPSLSAGDVTVSTDGGAFGNADTLPSVDPASGRAVKVTLSASEMNGANVIVIFHDAAGSEWEDLSISIQTSAAQIDDLATSTALATAQTDLDNPAQYKADVTAVQLANNAITSAKYDESTAFPVKSADTGSTQIARVGADSDTLETLSDEIAVVDGIVDAILLDTGTDGVVLKAAGLATDAVTEIVSALTAADASIASVASGVITQYRGDTWVISLTAIGDISSRSKLWFAVKNNKDNEYDRQALVLIEETDGLTYINGAVAGTSGNGTIAVSDEDVGNLTITLQEDESAKLPIKDTIYYSIKVLVSGVATTMKDGEFNIAASAVRTIS